MKQLKFNVEELHRGKWVAFIVTNKEGKEVQKRVIITQEQADWNNKQKDVFKLRYILASKKDKLPKQESEIDKIREEYKEVLGKNAFNGWGIDELKEKITEAKNSAGDKDEESGQQLAGEKK